jgi:membrane protein YqaA with SNARE-associated domain
VSLVPGRTTGEMLLSALQSRARGHNRALALFRHFGAFGLFFLAILDGTPLPTFGGPDILIVVLVVSRPNPWYEYAIAATAGSVIGAFLTFRVARRAGQAYLTGKFGGQRMPRLLKVFDRWGMSVVIGSCAIPFPLPTSVFFAAAGASGEYRGLTFLTSVALARGFRYAAVAIVARLYGRHVIRVLRHPAQYWGWFVLFAAVFVTLTVTGVLINKRFAEARG